MTEWTATTGTPLQPFNLDELGAVMMQRQKVPYGFFLSQALWDALVVRFLKESGDLLPEFGHAFNGIRAAVDPALPEAQFNVAFTQEAWTKRLRELRADGEDVREDKE